MIPIAILKQLAVEFHLCIKEDGLYLLRSDFGLRASHRNQCTLGVISYCCGGALEVREQCYVCRECRRMIYSHNNQDHLLAKSFIMPLDWNPNGLSSIQRMLELVSYDLLKNQILALEAYSLLEYWWGSSSG